MTPEPTDLADPDGDGLIDFDLPPWGAGGRGLEADAVNLLAPPPAGWDSRADEDLP